MSSTRLNTNLKHFDNFPPEGGCSEGLDAFRFFLNKYPHQYWLVLTLQIVAFSTIKGVVVTTGLYRIKPLRAISQIKYEAIPIGLADESKESLYGRETDRDLRSA